jgi:hypothetical protein
MELKVFTYPDEEYNGELDENYVRNGYGIYKYDNGDIYEGDFVEGLREGQGEYLYNDGSVYRGSWKEDKKHGSGSYKFDKFEFDGQWENDILRSGFTFKVNKFIRHPRGENDSDFNENYDYSLNESNDDSFELDPDRIDDDDYVKEEIAKRYALIQSREYNIDIDLYHIKTGDNKTILMDKLIKNRLPVYEGPSSSQHQPYCDLYKYSMSPENSLNINCRCKNSKKSSLN